MVKINGRTHTSLRPFACGFDCGKTFTQRSNLSKHEKMHRVRAQASALENTGLADPGESKVADSVANSNPFADGMLSLGKND